MVHLHEFVPELANPLQDLFLGVATTGLQSIGQFHYLQLEGGAEKGRSGEKMAKRERGVKERVGRKESGKGEIQEGKKRGRMETGLGKGKRERRGVKK